MKRWAWMVAGLYFAALVVLTVPALAAAFAPKVPWLDAAKVYLQWSYWLWIAVMVLSQVALLAVPVRVASRRPVTRGALWPTILAGGLMMAGLVFGGACSAWEFFFGGKPNGHLNGWIPLGIGLLTWCIWAAVFYGLSREVEPEDLVSRQCQLLFKGSILELLIAVPTHIVARYRDYCCAGFMTFIGLTMGVSVMLFSFGPATFFLYAERWKRLHPERTDHPE